MIYRSFLFLCLLVPRLCAFPDADSISASLYMGENPHKALSEWSDKTDVFHLTVSNQTDQAISLKIRTVITHDSILVAYTRFNDMPLVSLSPGTAVLTASALLPSDAIEFVWSLNRSSSRNGVLTPGVYSIGCEILDGANPDIVLSTTETKKFSVSGFEVPQLLEPLNYAWLHPQKPILFKWKGVNPAPQVPRIVRYKLLVFEARKGLDPRYVVETMTPLFEKFSDNVSPFSVVWPTIKSKLNSEMDYVWTVQAVDQNDKTLGDPDGMAEPFNFRIRK